MSTRLFSILLLIFLLLTNFSGFSQKRKNKKDKTEKKTEEKAAKKNVIKKYSDVITEDAESGDGLFKVHRIDEKYYFEIPFDLLNRDMLLVSRIAKIPAGLGGGYLNAGSKTNEQLVQWSRHHKNIHLKSISYNSVAA